MKTMAFLMTAICIGALSASLAYGEEKSKSESTTAVTPTPAFTSGKQQMFQPVAMDPALVRQSMQSRSEYDDLNRRIIARQTKLYEENPRIKELQIQLRDLQKKIDKLMAADDELNALKKKYAAIAPEIPMGARKGFSTNALPFATGR